MVCIEDLQANKTLIQTIKLYLLHKTCNIQALLCTNQPDIPMLPTRQCNNWSVCGVNYQAVAVYRQTLLLNFMFKLSHLIVEGINKTLVSLL